MSELLWAFAWVWLPPGMSNSLPKKVVPSVLPSDWAETYLYSLLSLTLVPIALGVESGDRMSPAFCLYYFGFSSRCTLGNLAYFPSLYYHIPLFAQGWKITPTLAGATGSAYMRHILKYLRRKSLTYTHTEVCLRAAVCEIRVLPACVRLQQQLAHFHAHWTRAQGIISRHRDCSLF